MALLLATQLIYPIGYSALKTMTPWAELLVLARNVGVLGWSVSLVLPPAWLPARAGRLLRRDAVA